MHRIYKSHGKHCVLRTFPTKCPKCKEDVLYWECTHGCKLFFNYPIYGKLIKHICKREVLNKKKKFPVIVKAPIKLLKEEKPSCSVCGKPFNSINDLNSHLREIKKIDPPHKLFYENSLICEDITSARDLKKTNEIKMDFQPKFGEINIKKREI